MINGIETSPSNRANCIKCRRPILKGELRGKIYNDRFNSFNFVCEECAYKEILSNIEELQKMKQELELVGVTE